MLGFSSPQLYVLTNIGSFVIGLPFLAALSQGDAANAAPLALSAMGYYFNSVAAFDLIASVNPVTFSVLNIYKRVIISGAYYLLAWRVPSVLFCAGMLITNVALHFFLQ